MRAGSSVFIILLSVFMLLSIFVLNFIDRTCSGSRSV